MELKIAEEKKEPLLSRKEVKLDMQYDGPTPKKDDVKEKVAGMLKADASNVFIRSILVDYGRTSGQVIARVYDNPDILSRIEKTGKEKKKNGEGKQS